MTYRKKLIEVALPLEAINIESAREKSIRHGHPSTLHLWWARRPLAACRAVLWASLVDDPSSWPERFPTEELQTKERQRLFDILGRIEIETDKKGNTKQVVRGLVSWDDINDPSSGVLAAGQREIARCLAWERGEEPPTKPDAVREYIAKYAPPAYDPFAGGGSIPLEAQRLGLEAHASDLNPVAVLINKALIEIPPKFRDKPPINPEVRVNRGQGVGNRDEEIGQEGKCNERGSVTSGSYRLAEGDGSGGSGVSAERELSQGGDVSPNQSDLTGSGLCTSEYSRGECKGDEEGLRAFSSDCQGVTDGNGNIFDAGGASQLPISAGSGSNTTIDYGNQQNANFSSQTPTSALNSPVSYSLFPIPYKGAQGLAADVRYYGQWMREEAFQRIGHLYPKVTLDNGTEATVIAWIWARTVKCPNPACGCQMPLVRSFQLSTKDKKEAWVEPIVGEREEGRGKREEEREHSSRLTPKSSLLNSHFSLLTPQIRFEIKSGKGKPPEGTVDRKGAKCIACESPVALDHVRSEGKAGRMGAQLMAIVAEGPNGRMYLPPTPEQEDIARSAQPTWTPETELVPNSRHVTPVIYGMTKHADLFTSRQLVALTTFSDLVTEAKEKAIQDAIAAGLGDDDKPLAEGGTGARAYGEAIEVYLAFATDKGSDYWSAPT